MTYTKEKNLGKMVCNRLGLTEDFQWYVGSHTGFSTLSINPRCTGENAYQKMVKLFGRPDETVKEFFFQYPGARRWIWNKGGRKITVAEKGPRSSRILIY